MQHVEVEPRADKDLGQLRLEWLNCTRCALGEQRRAVNGNMVFGEGRLRGIMLIASGPGENEEEQGRPFVGPSGRKVLRPILRALGVTEFAYTTNLVACRSCVQQYDNAGQPVFTGRGASRKPLWKDEDPPAPCIAACLPRLVEEIYIVDPIIIVAMGGAAAETLRGKPMAITRERGLPEEIEIPGATFNASLTDKRRAWSRGLGEDGKFRTPVVRNMVRYLMIPTLHPAFVARNLADKRPVPEGPFQCLAADIRLAAKVYERYRFETEGIMPSGGSDVEVSCEEEGD